MKVKPPLKEGPGRDLMAYVDAAGLQEDDLHAITTGLTRMEGAFGGKWLRRNEHGVLTTLLESLKSVVIVAADEVIS